MKISNTFLAIIAIALLLNACVLYLWVDAYKTSHTFTYLGTETLRVNNYTNHVEAYNPVQQKWNTVNQ